MRTRNWGRVVATEKDVEAACDYVLGGLAELTTWLERKGIIRLSFKDTWKATGS